MASLRLVRERLDRAGVPYLHATPESVGDRIYVRPDGGSRHSESIELIEYAPGAPRSGRLAGLATVASRE